MPLSFRKRIAKKGKHELEQAKRNARIFKGISKDVGANRMAAGMALTPGFVSVATGLIEVPKVQEYAQKIATALTPVSALLVRSGYKKAQRYVLLEHFSEPANLRKLEDWLAQSVAVKLAKGSTVNKVSRELESWADIRGSRLAMERGDTRFNAQKHLTQGEQLIVRNSVRRFLEDNPSIARDRRARENLRLLGINPRLVSGNPNALMPATLPEGLRNTLERSVPENERVAAAQALFMARLPELAQDPVFLKSLRSKKPSALGKISRLVRLPKTTGVPVKAVERSAGLAKELMKLTHPSSAATVLARQRDVQAAQRVGVKRIVREALTDIQSPEELRDKINGWAAIYKKWVKDEHGISKIYVLGHSFGTISSRWLAKNLGNEITGSIHSAAMNVANPRANGYSLFGFAYGTIAAPTLHVHNEDDACRGTPYSTVKEYAGENLVTVRGGVPEGDPCGATHLHSYRGREELVVRSIISWIKTRKVDRLIGE